MRNARTHHAVLTYAWTSTPVIERPSSARTLTVLGSATTNSRPSPGTLSKQPTSNARNSVDLPWKPPPTKIVTPLGIPAHVCVRAGGRADGQAGVHHTTCHGARYLRQHTRPMLGKKKGGTNYRSHQPTTLPAGINMHVLYVLEHVPCTYIYVWIDAVEDVHHVPTHTHDVRRRTCSYTPHHTHTHTYLSLIHI